MERKEVVEKATAKIDEEELKQEVDKVAQLIRKVRESKKLAEENEKALADYLAGKPLIRIKEDNSGNICISNGYAVGGTCLTLNSSY